LPQSKREAIASFLAQGNIIGPHETQLIRVALSLSIFPHWMEVEARDLTEVVYDRFASLLIKHARPYIL